MMFFATILLSALSVSADPPNVIGSEYERLIVAHDRMVVTKPKKEYSLAGDMYQYSPTLHLPYGCDVYRKRPICY